MVPVAAKPAIEAKSAVVQMQDKPCREAPAAALLGQGPLLGSRSISHFSFQNQEKDEFFIIFLWCGID